MAEFQWWVLILGLVAGGTIVGLLTTTFSRTDDDLEADERAAEATFIANHMAAGGHPVDPALVGRVLEVHREYLGLAAPTAIVAAEHQPATADQPATDTPMTRPTA